MGACQRSPRDQRSAVARGHARWPRADQARPRPRSRARCSARRFAKERAHPTVASRQMDAARLAARRRSRFRPRRRARSPSRSRRASTCRSPMGRGSRRTRPARHAARHPRARRARRTTSAARVPRSLRHPLRLGVPRDHEGLHDIRGSKQDQCQQRRDDDRSQHEVGPKRRLCSLHVDA